MNPNNYHRFLSNVFLSLLYLVCLLFFNLVPMRRAIVKKAKNTLAFVFKDPLRRRKLSYEMEISCAYFYVTAARTINSRAVLISPSFLYVLVAEFLFLTFLSIVLLSLFVAVDYTEMIIILYPSFNS